ncbi:MAG: hypothetical protein II350_03770 [Clostridia bacterium]|nr:hypothetical protein [Clostridia bacterium]
MPKSSLPHMFLQLQSEGCIDKSNIVGTGDGFFAVCKSLAEILFGKDISDFPDSEGNRLECGRFYDDWYLYAVLGENGYTYSLFKMREQEHDGSDGAFADGDTPGVTVSFIAFDCEKLFDCLSDSADGNRSKLNREINRVVALKGQNHNKVLKAYFADPRSEGAYLIASLYTGYIASGAENGYVDVPLRYGEILQKYRAGKKMPRYARLPEFVERVNAKAGYTLCDGERIWVKNCKAPTELERAVILATHTGNTSVYSFAAEIECHAKFLLPIAKLKFPFIGRSAYDSAIRADMTVGDGDIAASVPFYRSGSRIVRRQYALHRETEISKG